jgi:hypothetical protein
MKSRDGKSQRREEKRRKNITLDVEAPFAWQAKGIVHLVKSEQTMRVL